MLQRTILILLALCLVTTRAFATPTEDVKKTVDQVIRIVSDKEMKHNEKKRRQALKSSIGSIFDYDEMAKRSLSRHWKERSVDEKRQFSDLFANLLEKTYANKIESYNQEKVIFLKEYPEGNSVVVKSKVVTSKQDEYTMDYKLLNKGGKWMVYDVVIEGVSLVSNYRSQFNQIITAQGYGELVRKLQSKSNGLKAPAPH
jgi:phospholipid transport system substrate-binding protein